MRKYIIIFVGTLIFLELTAIIRYHEQMGQYIAGTVTNSANALAEPLLTLGITIFAIVMMIRSIF